MAVVAAGGVDLRRSDINPTGLASLSPLSKARFHDRMSSTHSLSFYSGVRNQHTSELILTAPHRSLLISNI